MPLPTEVVITGLRVPGRGKTPGARMLEILGGARRALASSGPILCPRVIGITAMAKATISRQRDITIATLNRTIFETKRVYAGFNICLSPSEAGTVHPICLFGCRFLACYYRFP